MIDQIDRANEIAQADREEAVRKIVAVVAGQGTDDCQDCGDAIEEARKRAVPSARRCVGCQAAAERRAALHAARVA